MDRVQIGYISELDYGVFLNVGKKATQYNRIKEVLQEQGKTQGWLADQLDVEFQTISRYANNRRQPSIETLFEIAKILKVSARELIRE